MPVPTKRRIVHAAILTALIVGLLIYSRNQPGSVPDAARGRQAIQRMSDRLASVMSFSVTTEETRDRTPQGGEAVRRMLTRQTILRRNPDRLHFVTSGDSENEVWYDGVGTTLVSHKDKVFAQARMPETLDRALDAIHERYGIQMPLGDLLYTSAARALIADTTTGGWMGSEDIDGVRHDRVRFEDKDVAWEMWIPASGEPLPRRLVTDFNERRAANHVVLTFRDWNLSPVITDNQFVPRVPPDYEGIAMLQRASVLRNIPEEPASPGNPKP